MYIYRSLSLSLSIYIYITADGSALPGDNCPSLGIRQICTHSDWLDLSKPSHLPSRGYLPREVARCTDCGLEMTYHELIQIHKIKTISVKQLINTEMPPPPTIDKQTHITREQTPLSLAERGALPSA